MNWQGLLYLCVSEETCSTVPLVRAHPHPHPHPHPNAHPHPRPRPHPNAHPNPNPNPNPRPRPDQVKADYLSRSSFFSARPSFFLSLYVLLFATYVSWSVAHFFKDLRPLLEMHALFKDKLHICDTDLQAIQWDTIVQRIVDLQQTSRLCIVKDQLTAHDIANRILRKERYVYT